MTHRVLYVAASPRGEESASRQIADAFIKELSFKNPTVEVEKLDLWRADLPELGPAAVSGRYRLFAAEQVSDFERTSWERVAKVADEVKKADVLVVSSPMWNFSIPYKLKHWLDLVIQPRHTFSFDPESGYSGLIRNKPAVLALSRAGEYPGGVNSGDHQLSYLDLTLGFIGFSPIHRVVLEPSFTGNEAADGARLEAAISMSRQLVDEVSGQITGAAVVTT